MRPLSLFIAWILWAGIVWMTPSSVYWRDSGEFIIQAYALDIAHPAGFPTYAMAANLFALMPIGPIPWRIILLSGAALIAMLPLLTSLIGTLIPKPTQRLAPLCALIALIVSAVLMPALIKQVFSAEVYILNALFLIAVALLTVISIRDKDTRPLAAAAFLGGLALGNHVSALFSAAPLALILISSDSRVRKSLCILTVFCFSGAAVYAYLPIRALENPPLNSGSPDTVLRFWNVISDARDRYLRVSSSAEEHTSALDGFDRLVANPLLHFSGDLEKLRIFPPALTVTIAILSMVIMLRTRPRESACVCAIAAGNYLFFAGWDGDPWLPAFALLSALCLCALCAAADYFKLLRAMPAFATLLIAAIICVSPVETTLAELNHLKNYREPARITEEWLNSTQAQLVISENSWFLARYLSTIEGVADEKTIIYQPSILFPEYFSAARISAGTEIFDTAADATAHAVSNEPSFGTLGRLIEKASAFSPIALEPSSPLNIALHPIILISQHGIPEVHRGKTREATESPELSIITRLEPLAQAASDTNSFISADARNYFENILNSYADLLRRQSLSGEAAALLEKMCFPRGELRCSLVSLNHLGLVWIEQKRFADATALFKRLIENNPHEASTLTKNLRKAQRGEAS